MSEAEREVVEAALKARQHHWSQCSACHDQSTFCETYLNLRLALDLATDALIRTGRVRQSANSDKVE